MTTFIGIDPGKAGGIALIGDDVAIAHRYPGDITQAANLLRELHANNTISLACIEKVSAMPGQGVTSMFSFGLNVGGWYGILAALGIPMITVTPAKWQKAMLDAGTGETKARSLSMARRLFVDVDLKFKADDGKADALHLARWAQRSYLSDRGQ